MVHPTKELQDDHDPPLFESNSSTGHPSPSDRQTEVCVCVGGGDEGGGKNISIDRVYTLTVQVVQTLSVGVWQQMGGTAALTFVSLTKITDSVIWILAGWMALHVEQFLASAHGEPYPLRGDLLEALQRLTGYMQLYGHEDDSWQ
ncbi:hypothetical protein PC116_g15693 [Phytophthora cactorum]|uniref:Uncharacterized protein n=1 Tax=Phytophthora cactorum TaxID=29920 RepID=A0A8T1KNZ4_9STRA|nr:hypothetical protein PC112_g7595 [Phytophthora cactorum]KAG2860908.1 hypothetical protein PC113_g7649 [Phytophthora cactorum]KAG2942251.1 hypothetical protein PC117_g9867 [Phytophthora cactorum]KAG4236211.1 hypothetical protein PC116_g15693 [Phytophthora cactorum]